MHSVVDSIFFFSLNYLIRWVLGLKKIIRKIKIKKRIKKTTSIKKKPHNTEEVLNYVKIKENVMQCTESRFEWPKARQLRQFN